MNRRLVVCVLGAVLVASGDVAAQDPDFYVFLCFGQSNMEGFPGIVDEDRGPVDDRFQLLAAVDFPELRRKQGGWSQAVPPLCRPEAGLCPADYFGRTLVERLPPKIRVGVVNVSVGGCKIELFDKTGYESHASQAPAWMVSTINAYGGNPYGRLVEMARVAQKRGVVKGILLHQGESNTNDKQWPAKVKGVYQNLLNDLDLNAAEVPLIVGELVSAEAGGACASMNAMIRQLPRTIPTARVVSSEDCDGLPDHLHFTPRGYRELGKRYADVMLPLLTPNIKNPQ